VIDAMHGHSDAVVRESADLIYNLVVLWASSGIHPKDVWAEMARRERLLGIAEKIPKDQGAKGLVTKSLVTKDLVTKDLVTRTWSPTTWSRSRDDEKSVHLDRAGCASGADVASPGRKTGFHFFRKCSKQPPCFAECTTGASAPPANRTPLGSWAPCRSWKARSFRFRPTPC